MLAVGAGKKSQCSGEAWGLPAWLGGEAPLQGGAGPPQMVQLETEAQGVQSSSAGGPSRDCVFRIPDLHFRKFTCREILTFTSEF